MIVIGAGAIGFGVFTYFQSQKPDAGLKIDTNPSSLVFIDNVQVGKTPIDKVFKSGDITIRLVPDSTSSALTSYQTKVHLTSHTYTVLKRDFGDTDLTSAGETVNLEAQSGKIASLAIVTSSPDSASVTVDGQPQGFTPVLVPSLPEGDHRVTLSAPGFVSRTISAKALLGYKLNINAKLAGQLPQPTPSPEASGSATYIKIKATPTGFLRVRLTPSTTAKEVGRVHPDEKYPLLDKLSGWYQIEINLEATTSGWISSQYATSDLSRVQ